MQAPNSVGCKSQHMDYTSHAMDEVMRFYTETLGFSNFQHDPSMNYLFVVTGPSSSLGFMPPMPGPPDQWRPPREPVIYLMVQDVNQAHGELMAKGVTFAQPPTDMPWGHRVAMLKDPEGRGVCLAQALTR
jgi:predicted enzyme related to lactoylglutathione lyase